MTKHKHAELIKAKVDNMDLAVFFKSNASAKWIKIYCSNNNGLPSFYEGGEYFLCHPKHADVCLHWLNGGEAQNVAECSLLGVVSKSEFGDWRKNSAFMDEVLDLRIKPRKEKRWIGYHKYGPTTAMTYLRKEDAMADTVDHEKWQFIEIEVEG